MKTEMIDANVTSGMFLTLIPLFVFGAVVLIGLTALAIKKLGLFEKKEVSINTSSKRCNAHEELIKALSKFETQQATNITNLKNGKDQFKEIQGEIEALKIGLYVLIESSGAKMPEVLKGVKVI
jgi:TolA-binding protein